MTSRRIRDPNRLVAKPEPQDIRASLVDMYELIKPFRVVVTADYAVTGNAGLEFVVCNNTSAITVTLQQYPDDLDRVYVKRLNTGAVTIAANGNLIDQYTSLGLSQNEGAQLQYDESLGVWLRI